MIKCPKRGLTLWTFSFTFGAIFPGVQNGMVGAIESLRVVILPRNCSYSSDSVSVFEWKKWTSEAFTHDCQVNIVNGQKKTGLLSACKNTLLRRLLRRFIRSKYFLEALLTLSSIFFEKKWAPQKKRWFTHIKMAKKGPKPQKKCRSAFLFLMFFGG